MAEAERSGDTFEIFAELVRQDGMDVSREELGAVYDRQDAYARGLIEAGKIDPAKMTALDWFILLCRADGIEMSDGELKAQYEAIGKEKTVSSRRAFN